MTELSNSYFFYCFSQKVSIAELKAQLDQERDQRRVEREKAEADLKAAVQKAQSEAQEELKRISDAASRRDVEQQEVINKLQVRKS
jgi:DNA-binding transcriptional MerR regulator